MRCAILRNPFPVQELLDWVPRVEAEKEPQKSLTRMVKMLQRRNTALFIYILIQ